MTIIDTCSCLKKEQMDRRGDQAKAILEEVFMRGKVEVAQQLVTFQSQNYDYKKQLNLLGKTYEEREKESPPETNECYRQTFADLCIDQKEDPQTNFIKTHLKTEVELKMLQPRNVTLMNRSIKGHSVVMVQLL